jgi:hypothetical protein
VNHSSFSCFFEKNQVGRLCGKRFIVKEKIKKQATAMVFQIYANLPASINLVYRKFAHFLEKVVHLNV